MNRIFLDQWCFAVLYAVPLQPTPPPSPAIAFSAKIPRYHHVMLFAHTKLGHVVVSNPSRENGFFYNVVNQLDRPL